MCLAYSSDPDINFGQIFVKLEYMYKQDTNQFSRHFDFFKKAKKYGISDDIRMAK